MRVTVPRVLSLVVTLLLLGLATACNNKVDRGLVGSGGPTAAPAPATTPAVAPTNGPASVATAASVAAPVVAPAAPPAAAAGLSIPEGVDQALWASLAVGLPDPLAVDLAQLASASDLDADFRVEGRPVVLTRVGLWGPILQALPAQVRKGYQEVCDAVGTDPIPRIDTAVVAGRRGAARKGVEKLSIYARVHGGLVLDLFRWLQHNSIDDKDADGMKATLVLLEALTTAELESLRTLVPSDRPTTIYELGSGAVIAIPRDLSEVTMFAPGGVVGVNGPFDSPAAAVQALTRLHRRIAESATASDDKGSDADDHLASVKWSDPAKGFTQELELGLGQALTVTGRYVSTKAGAIAEAEAELRDPAFADKYRARNGQLMRRTVDELIRAFRFKVDGAVLSFGTQASVTSLLTDLGGATAPLEPGEAQTLGGGFDGAAIDAAVDSPIAARTADVLASSGAAARGEGASFVYAPAQNPRNDALRRWFEREGSLRRFAENVGRTFPRAVPVVVDECGTANAFYHPRTGTITLCYELAGDLVSKLRKAFSKEHLGPAVVGAMLFVLIHEYGHALIHQSAVPAVGREEDAVDQLAAVSLIESGPEGVKYAFAAMLWYQASERLGATVPAWDEHSDHGVRKYDIACLIYGSDPAKYGFIADRGLLPASRARRCPTEYAKARGSWDQLLADAARGQGAPGGGGGSTPVGVAPAPAAPVVPATSVPAAPAPAAPAAPCAAIFGSWDFTTTVTAATKGSGIGTQGYYRMGVDAACNVAIEKVGYGAKRFAEAEVQRGYGKFTADGSGFVVGLGLGRGGATDYTVAFRFEVGAGLTGTWQYTGASYDATGFQGALIGSRR